jgi:hypothetical protein
MEIDDATFQRNWRATVAVCLAYVAILFDHFVGNSEQRRWNAQSEHAINNEFEPRRLLDR